MAGNADLVPDRSWDVLLVGGPSGAGKTTVASRVARHFAVGIGAVDDFQIIVEQLTTPDQHPALHFWRTHPDPALLSATEIMEQGLEVARVMAPALEAVIADPLEARAPIVLEGDFLAPSLAAQTCFSDQPNAGRVRAVFLIESDEVQILRNFAEREPAFGPQHKRARVSWLHGQWLAQECARLGVPALSVRPWATLFDRVLQDLNGPADAPQATRRG